MKQPTQTELEEIILSKYGSWSEPHFHFVDEDIETRPYRALVDDLTRLCYVHEETDLNADVSFHYYIASSKVGRIGDERAALKLSMVARYAFMYRIQQSHREPVGQPQTPFEAAVVKLLERHKVALLWKETVSHPLPLKLFYTDPENVTVYQALFSDEDVVPWS